MTKESIYLFGQLSPREIQILSLIANELTSKEIAEKLSISLETVKSHRKHMMHKLNARNTAGLIRKAFEYHLLLLG